MEVRKIITVAQKTKTMSKAAACAKLKPECGPEPKMPDGIHWDAMIGGQRKALIKSMSTWMACDKKMDAWKQLCAKSTPLECDPKNRPGVPISGRMSSMSDKKQNVLMKKIYERKLRTYWTLAKKLGPAEAALGAVECREMFKDRDKDVRRWALKAYMTLAEKLGPAEAALGAVACREMFKNRDKDVRLEALYTYKKLVKKLNPAEVALEAVACRKLLKDRDKGVREAALDAYRELVKKLGPAEVALKAVTYRERFKDCDKNVRLEALYIYETLAEGLNMPEIILGSVTSWEVYKKDSDEDVRATALFTSYKISDTYKKLVEKLSTAEAAPGAVICREMFKDNGIGVREAALSEYRVLALAKKLSPAEAALGVAACHDLYLWSKERNKNDKDAEEVGRKALECKSLLCTSILSGKPHLCK